MAGCSIHYVEQTWDGYPNFLDVWVNLTDLYLGKDCIEPHEAFAPDRQGRDITAQLSAADLRKLFDALHRVQIGYAAEPLMGLDGSSHELTVDFAPMTSVSCRWWVEVPAEWKGVEEIVRILRKGAKAASKPLP